jgi:deglycase
MPMPKKKSSKIKRAAVLVEQLYQELEVWYPYYRLKEAGYDVKLVGPDKGAGYPSKLGYTAVAELGALSAAKMKWDVLVVPGGYAPDFMRRTTAMIDLVKGANKSGAVIGSICHGGWLLISADIVRDRSCTSFFAIKDDMVNAGAKWKDDEVVIDDNLVTSRKPDDLPAFMAAILNLVENKPKK